MRTDSMCCPTMASTAGSRVRAASTAVTTATAAEYPSAVTRGIPATRSARRAITTVDPAKTIALPEVATAIAICLVELHPLLAVVAVAGDQEERVVDADAEADHRRDRRSDRRDGHAMAEERDERQPHDQAEHCRDDRQSHRDERPEREREDDHRGGQADDLAAFGRGLGQLASHRAPDGHLHTRLHAGIAGSENTLGDLLRELGTSHVEQDRDERRLLVLADLRSALLGEGIDDARDLGERLQLLVRGFNRLLLVRIGDLPGSSCGRRAGCCRSAAAGKRAARRSLAAWLSVPGSCRLLLVLLPKPCASAMRAAMPTIHTPSTTHFRRAAKSPSRCSARAMLLEARRRSRECLDLRRTRRAPRPKICVALSSTRLPPWRPSQPRPLSSGLTQAVCSQFSVSTDHSRRLQIQRIPSGANIDRAVKSLAARAVCSSLFPTRGDSRPAGGRGRERDTLEHEARGADRKARRCDRPHTPAVREADDPPPSVG